jgi:hypothetical protein
MATQETARQEAAAALKPHASDPAIAAIIASLTGESEGEDDALEKAMTKISAAREALIKDESVSPAQAFEVGQRLEKAEKALQSEYLQKHSEGYRIAEANNREAERLRVRNLGGAA